VVKEDAIAGFHLPQVVPRLKVSDSRPIGAAIANEIIPGIGFGFLLDHPNPRGWAGFRCDSLLTGGLLFVHHLCKCVRSESNCARALGRVAQLSYNLLCSFNFTKWIADIMAKLKEGDKAPDFAVPDAEGKTVRLKDLRGKKVVLYFYPKDDTPGCTKEACSFRDAFSKFKRRGIEVLGVSLDSEKSHQKFAKKFDLPFRLLADTDRDLSESFGTYGEKKFMGRTYMGVNRMTFLIDEKGKIKKIFNKVKPEDHAEEVLAAFQE
jgi:peroxiredoxin Q/BCP